MSSFGAQVLRLMRANKPYVVDDVDNDPQVTEEDLAAYRQTAIQAVICVPLHKNGRFAACMAVHQKQPRRWTAEKGARLPAIALTAYAGLEDRVRALKAGFQTHIPKPVEPAELLAVVVSLINGFGKDYVG
jgi:CheY-like chemotaxis protein